MTGKRDNARRANRRQAMLDAAEMLFLDQGFEKVSLNAIVKQSGGSLSTVYALFGNKHGLLRAVVDRARDEGLREFDTIDDEGKSPGNILHDIGLRYYAFVTAPRTLALLRLVIGESLNDPEFGRQFVHDMQLHLVARIAEAFSHWTAMGKAHVDRPQEAAKLYFAIVLRDAPVWAMLGVAPEPTTASDLEWRLAPFLEHFGITT